MAFNQITQITCKLTLGVDNKTALFKTIRYTYNAGDELVELRESFIRGDKFRFSVELTL